MPCRWSGTPAPARRTARAARSAARRAAAEGRDPDTVVRCCPRCSLAAPPRPRPPRLRATARRAGPSSLVLRDDAADECGDALRGLARRLAAHVIAPRRLVEIVEPTPLRAQPAVLLLELGDRPAHACRVAIGNRAG